MVLDATLFYPEGGGQEADHGTLAQAATSANVLDTQKIGDVIVHFTDQIVDVDAPVKASLTGNEESNSWTITRRSTSLAARVAC